MVDGKAYLGERATEKFVKFVFESSDAETLFQFGDCVAYFSEKGSLLDFWGC